MMRSARAVVSGIMIAAASATGVRAQNAPPPTSCTQQAESRQFDFWVGSWDVTGVKGQAVGHSVVQKILGSCALLENWTNQSGGEGKSLNAYNPLLKRWQQFWVDQYGRVTEYRESRWVGASLQLTARDSTPQGEQMRRMTFTPLDSLTVRQFGELSTDGGATWKVSFDLLYHRKG